MLARRALAVTPDKDFAKALTASLMSAGTVAETAASVADLPDEVNADVCAIHLPTNDIAELKKLGARIKPEAWIVVILGRSDLSFIVETMQATDRVAGILIADRLQPGELPATITRLLHGDIFGLEKVVPWGTRIYSLLVSDYQEKSIAINQISEFAATVGVRRKYREALEQCADEMLMNAMYDAPVGAGGKPLFADVSTKERVGLKLEQPVVVQYACDSRSFALSVRDSYGSFARDTLLRFLHKCLHSEQQIDRKAGGAGLGLYLMANSASLILFNLLPGVATEVICIFDITAPKLQLQHLGVFSEKVDATGRLIAGPQRTSGVPLERRAAGGAAEPGLPKALMLALGSAIVLLLAIIALVAYPRFSTITGHLAITTQPPGAAIEIDGRLRGTTEGGQLVVRDLQADTGHRVVARLAGHGDAETLIEVEGGQTAAIQLALPTRTATVAIDSEPAGATVIADGRQLGVTPLTSTDLAPGAEVQLSLRLAGYRDTVRKLRVPAAGGQASVSVSLPVAAELASVNIASVPSGAAVFQNGERLAGLITPVVGHLIEADRPYAFTLELGGYMPATLEARVRPGQREVPLTATLQPGGSLVVTSTVPGRVNVSSTTACKKRTLPLDCPIENGRHRVELKNDEPYVDEAFDAQVQGDEVRHDFRLGIVQAREGFRLGVGSDTRRAIAKAEGRHAVTLVPSDGTDTQSVTVEVRPGQTVSVP